MGKSNVPLNENVVCHRRSCYRPNFNIAIDHFLSQQYFVKTVVNSLLETAGELKQALTLNVLFLTKFWPSYGMVHFTSERLIWSHLWNWDIYEISIATSLKQNYCIPANIPKQKSGTLSQKCAHVHNHKPEKSTKLRLGLLGLREGFSWLNWSQ